MGCQKLKIEKCGHYPRPCHRTPSGLAVLDHPYRPPRLVWRRSWHLCQSEALLDIKAHSVPRHSFNTVFNPHSPPSLSCTAIVPQVSAGSTSPSRFSPERPLGPPKDTTKLVTKMPRPNHGLLFPRGLGSTFSSTTGRWVCPRP